MPKNDRIKLRSTVTSEQLTRTHCPRTIVWSKEVFFQANIVEAPYAKQFICTDKRFIQRMVLVHTTHAP